MIVKYGYSEAQAKIFRMIKEEKPTTTFRMVIFLFSLVGAIVSIPLICLLPDSYIVMVITWFATVCILIGGVFDIIYLLILKRSW